MNTNLLLARMLGIAWAERTFTSYERARKPIPWEWPGKLLDRDMILSACPELPEDPSDQESLIREIQRIAKDTWREMIMPE